ncbi:WD repeat and SOCS box-containing protein 2 isoform X1 [Anguilla anguilla]|uniref:SOCS box domain-containing protein n=1 Tax=Anguilla anguilla TaxID=7936 RepID=A0A9D3M0P1_ANGAN|nr:WD repeat and SOCS box-containing protein 2 isoform X1 [Anguilla anguilla]KAG5840421.1 hypothetical protein ANANG_G00188640 [Anguilla anguilla]
MDSDNSCSSNRPADIQRKEESAPLIGELRPIHPPSVDGRAGCETWSVEFSPDGSYFAWSKGYGIVQLLRWPLQGIEWHGTPQFTAAAKERTLDCGQTVWGLAFGPRASRYAGRSDDQLRRTSETAQPLLLATGLSNGEIKVWEVETGRLCFNLRGHQSIVRDLVFAPNGSLTLVSGSRDTTLRIWNLKKSDNSQVLKGHTDWVYSVSVSPDCSMIASVCRRNPKVFLWSLRSYTFIRHLQNANTWQVSCDFSPDGALLATAAYLANWETSLWDPYTGEHLFRLQECFSCNFPIMDNPIRAVRFSSDGLHLAFITMDREIRVWEIGQDEPLIESERRHFSCGLCCTFHPQGGVIATGTRDGHVKFWNVPQAVPSLVHFCRMALRFSVSTHQVMALPIPGKIRDILTYRNYEEHYDLLCSYHRCRQ